MSPEFLQFLPDNWTGLVAVVMFVFYIGAQIVEKYETIAKFLPGGQWWHARQKRRKGARKDLVAEENEVIRGLQEQVGSIAGEMRELKETLRTFTAWSVYDARWHHQTLISSAANGYVLPEHLDYFAFEALWKTDPISAARLPHPKGV